jgi:hypothetical protein
MPLTFSMGLECTGMACCPPCDPDFDSSLFFLGNFYDPVSVTGTSAVTRKAPEEIRPWANAKRLQESLEQWRSSLEFPPLVHSRFWILSNKNLKLLSKMHPDKLTQPACVTETL